jgi:hypothetical protein
VPGAGDDDQIVEYDGARLENADDKKLDALGNALNLMAEVLCQEARRVAFIYRPPEEVSYPHGVYLVGPRHNNLNRLHKLRRNDGALIMDVGQGVALAVNRTAKSPTLSLFMPVSPLKNVKAVTTIKRRIFTIEHIESQTMLKIRRLRFGLFRQRRLLSYS